MENCIIDITSNGVFDVIEVHNGRLLFSEDDAKELYDAVDTGTAPSKLEELRKRAEAGEIWAMYYYARLYAISNRVKRNYELAVDYLTKAANAGNAPAMNSLANRYQRGEGLCKIWQKQSSGIGERLT